MQQWNSSRHAYRILALQAFALDTATPAEAALAIQMVQVYTPPSALRSSLSSNKAKTFHIRLDLSQVNQAIVLRLCTYTLHLHCSLDSMCSVCSANLASGYRLKRFQYSPIWLTSHAVVSVNTVSSPVNACQCTASMSEHIGFCVPDIGLCVTVAVWLAGKRLVNGSFNQVSVLTSS